MKYGRKRNDMKLETKRDEVELMDPIILVRENYMYLQVDSVLTSTRWFSSSRARRCGSDLL